MNRAGFSLVELAVVVAIAGVLAATASVTVLNRMPAHRLRGATWQVMSDLRAARMTAATENARVTVTLNGANRQYSIWTDRNGNGLQDSGETEVHSLAHVSGLSMSTYPSSGVFTSRGSFETGAHYLYIYLTVPSGGGNYIYVFPSGQVDAPSA